DELDADTSAGLAEDDFVTLPADDDDTPAPIWAPDKEPTGELAVNHVDESALLNGSWEPQEHVAFADLSADDERNADDTFVTEADFAEADRLMGEDLYGSDVGTEDTDDIEDIEVEADALAAYAEAEAVDTVDEFPGETQVEDVPAADEWITPTTAEFDIVPETDEEAATLAAIDGDEPEETEADVATEDFTSEELAEEGLAEEDLIDDTEDDEEEYQADEDTYEGPDDADYTDEDFGEDAFEQGPFEAGATIDELDEPVAPEVVEQAGDAAEGDDTIDAPERPTDFSAEPFADGFPSREVGVDADAAGAVAAAGGLGGRSAVPPLAASSEDIRPRISFVKPASPAETGPLPIVNPAQPYYPERDEQKPPAQTTPTPAVTIPQPQESVSTGSHAVRDGEPSTMQTGQFPIINPDGAREPGRHARGDDEDGTMARPSWFMPGKTSRRSRLRDEDGELPENGPSAADTDTPAGRHHAQPEVSDDDN
ncbi:MAG: hypothetical protein E6298_06355, partial [Lawsonella clevelandensis]|nr:hypothetical protein [Lawsonella clevelandensis]